MAGWLRAGTGPARPVLGPARCKLLHILAMAVEWTTLVIDRIFYTLDTTGTDPGCAARAPDGLSLPRTDSVFN
jgi:hypothetical protein